MKRMSFKMLAPSMLVSLVFLLLSGSMLIANPFEDEDAITEVQETCSDQSYAHSVVETLHEAEDGSDGMDRTSEEDETANTWSGAADVRVPPPEDAEPAVSNGYGQMSSGSGVSGRTGVIAKAQGKFGIKARGCSNGEVEMLRKVLETLPKFFYDNTKVIQIVGHYGGAAGYVQMGIPVVNITPLGRGQGMDEVVVHEMAHCFQAEHSDITEAFSDKFWPGGQMRGRSVSQYGCTQMIEDMAECCRAYWAKGAKMKKYYPERYEFIKQYVFQGKEYL